MPNSNQPLIRPYLLSLPTTSTTNTQSETYQTLPTQNLPPQPSPLQAPPLQTQPQYPQMQPPQQPIKREYLDMIPDFTGDQQTLPRFIDISDKIISKFFNFVDTTDFQNEVIIHFIISKIKGEAANKINSYNSGNWEDLKTFLIETYSDKKDIYILSLELTSTRQNSNQSPFEFHDQISSKLQKIIEKIELNFDETEKRPLQIFMTNLALRVLLKGLRDPVGQSMRTKDLQSLGAALNMLTNDFQYEAKLTNQKIVPPNAPTNKPFFQKINTPFNPNRHSTPFNRTPNNPPFRTPYNQQNLTNTPASQQSHFPRKLFSARPPPPTNKFNSESPAKFNRSNLNHHETQNDQIEENFDEYENDYDPGNFLEEMDSENLPTADPPTTDED